MRDILCKTLTIVRKVKQVINKINLDKYNNLHPLQWVKVYGIFSSRCDHIITCQGYQLGTILRCLQPDWWEDVVVEAVEEEELPISA